MPIRYTNRFKYSYVRLPISIRKKVMKTITLLEADFRHPGLRSHQMKGYTNIYEACVDQKYRMTYERQGDFMIMRNVDNHDECLKNP